MVIWSQQTFPPGLTFLFLRFSDKLKLNMSYSTSSLSPSEMLELENELKKILLN
jgi:hypothetical protein